MEERVASPPEDSAGRRTKQLFVETRTEERVASLSCEDSACRRTIYLQTAGKGKIKKLYPSKRRNGKSYILSTGRRGPFFAGVRLAPIAARTS